MNKGRVEFKTQQWPQGRTELLALTALWSVPSADTCIEPCFGSWLDSDVVQRDTCVWYLLSAEKRDDWNLSMTGKLSEINGISMQVGSDNICCICAKNVEEEEDT
jgi:hypothetical protein